MDFYQRAYSLDINGVLISGLRIQFKATKSLEKEPNKLELKIYNLNADTRGKLKEKGLPITLSAGYAEGSGIIFKGESRTIVHGRSGADWITEIHCGDGETAYSTARFNVSLGKNVSKADVMRAAIKSLGLNPGNSENMIKSIKDTFSKGFAANMNGSQALTNLTEAIGLKWSIQDGAIQFRTEGEAVGNVLVKLSADTGLIGTPEISAPKDQKKAAMLKLKSFLNHHLGCGVPVDLQAIGLKGRFRVEKLEHSGDFEGKEWFTDMELTETK